MVVCAGSGWAATLRMSKIQKSINSIYRKIVQKIIITYFVYLIAPYVRFVKM